MITFLTTAKPFAGAASDRQRNALRSWSALSSDVEVILFGDGEGYAGAARELGLVHIAEVEKGSDGVPRIDSMFAIARERGKHELQCYINCDIILLDNFVRAAQRIDFERFLMVAQRWDVTLTEEIHFEDPTWQRKLEEVVRGRGTLLHPHGIDFFLTKGDVWGELAPMVVGRAHFDNWLLYYCRAMGTPVVDATDVVTAVHQEHDYSHVAGGRDTVFVGDEAKRNLDLGGGERHMFTIQDADWRLAGSGLKRNWYRGDSERSAEVYRILNPKSKMVQLRAGVFLAQAWCELVVRLKRGKIGPILRYPPWLVARAFGKR